MKTVLIANNDYIEARALADKAGEEFNVLAINFPSQLPDTLHEINLVLLDSNFAPIQDFIGAILNRSYVPILVVAPQEDEKSAVEALKAGANNYIIKTKQYLELINVIIAEEIQKFDKYERMQQTINDLNKKVARLEERLAAYEKAGQGRPPAQNSPSPQKRRTIFDEIVARLKRGEINLPSPPQILMKFDQMLREGESIAEIAKLLKQDVTICSKLISISNSAYYQGLRENKTVEQAISRLGLISTKKYVEIIYNRALYTTQKRINLDLMEKLWKHSLSCGLAAQATCDMINVKQAEEVFTMGLIHDIGKLILLQICSELDIDINGSKMNPEERTDLLKMFALNHGAFGATLLSRWGFSNDYQQIALLHDNLESADPIFKELLIVHFANQISKASGYEWEDEKDLNIKESLSARLLQLDSLAIKLVSDKVQNHMLEMQKMFY
jgi:HD-like signal output (HDOD) protein